MFSLNQAPVAVPDHYVPQMDRATADSLFDNLVMPDLFEIDHPFNVDYLQSTSSGGNCTHPPPPKNKKISN